MTSAEELQPEPTAPGPVAAKKSGQSFSLSALFFLMVVVSSLLGFVSQALPGKAAPEEVAATHKIQTKSFNRTRNFRGVAVAALLITAVIIGVWRGFRLQGQKSAALIGMLYGGIATLVAGTALLFPPNWIMVGFCCAMLIVTGYLLRLGQIKQLLPAENSGLE